MNKSTRITVPSDTGFGSSLTALLPILLILAILQLQGCGGSAGTEAGIPATPESGTLLQGVAADGYLAEAQVFLDINGNKLADTDEPVTTTDNDGSFSLRVSPGQERLYPVVVRTERNRTRDTESGFVADDYILEAPIGHHGFISPLTTLVKQELDKNTAFSETDAVNLVRSRFGLADDVSFWQDYLVEETGPWQQTHMTARLLAGLQGRLLAQLQENLGGTLQDDDYLPATRLVSDLLMQQAPVISRSLSGVQPAAALTPEQQIEQLLASIDLVGLDRQLLNRYRQLIDKHPATWDATPPAITASSPQANSEVPVTSRIEVAFNEPLDPSSLAADAVTLSRNGVVLPGSLSYNKNLLLVTLTPEQPLAAYAEFNVTVSAAISDQLGNPLGTERNWTFHTLFAQTPPTLPDF